MLKYLSNSIKKNSNQENMCMHNVLNKIKHYFVPSRIELAVNHTVFIVPSQKKRE